MVTVLCDDKIRAFINKQYNHPCVNIFHQTYNMVMFDPCYETVALLMMAAQDLMEEAEGDVKILIGQADHPPQPRHVGHA